MLFYSVILHSLLHSREVKNINIEWDFTPYETLCIVLGSLHEDHDNDDKITNNEHTLRPCTGRHLNTFGL